MKLFGFCDPLVLHGFCKLIFDSQGYILTSEIDGTIQMKSYLTGNPEIRLALNEDLIIGRNGSSVYGIFLLLSVMPSAYVILSRLYGALISLYFLNCLYFVLDLLFMQSSHNS